MASNGWDETSSDCAAMVAERNLPADFVDNASGPTITKALEQLTHVKLDRENISWIDEIRYIFGLPNLTHLYLQQNGLKCLDGIGMAKGIKFLIVSDNQLLKLNGLSSLSQLMVLDASDNAIARIDAAELPPSLSFLNVDGNPCCTSQEGLREHLKSALPNLKELDGDPLTDYTCSDDSTESEGETEEEEEDQSTCREEDHVEELEGQAGMQLDFRTPGDIGKEVTPGRKARKGRSRIVTPSGERCSSSVMTCTSTSSKRESTQPPIPEVVVRLGTPSSVAKAFGSTLWPHPDEALETALDADMVEFCQLKDSLCENNLDAEGAVQTVLSHTVGGLDYHCNMMIERSHERMKSLDVQLGQEIVEMFFSPVVEMFFSPEASRRSTPKSVDQSQGASSSSNSSVMSPRSVDHWKYIASTSSESSDPKETLSVGNTDSVDFSYQDASEQEDKEYV